MLKCARWCRYMNIYRIYIYIHTYTDLGGCIYIYIYIYIYAYRFRRLHPLLCLVFCETLRNMIVVISLIPYYFLVQHVVIMFTWRRQIDVRDLLLKWKLTSSTSTIPASNFHIISSAILLRLKSSSPSCKKWVFLCSLPYVFRRGEEVIMWVTWSCHSTDRKWYYQWLRNKAWLDKMILPFSLIRIGDHHRLKGFRQRHNTMSYSCLQYI